MTIALRDSVAHVFVDDLAAPTLSDDDQHHLARVLRVRDGESVSASNGRGGWRLCQWRDGGLHGESEVHHVAAPTPRLGVAFVPVKGDRPEWAVQKLTEIGVDDIIVLAPTRRAVVRWGDDKHLRKLQVVAREAAMQSRRVWLPTVTGPMSLAEVCARPGAAVADPAGEPLDAEPLNAAARDASAPSPATSLIIIGPEGGFDADELTPSVRRVSLGDTILRAETATLVAATLLATLRNRMKGPQ
ncbi:MAG: 16S rRNA (uracil(1498)-N(3))-methyltransferase [Actinobacteria bacterium]|nr:16S rRNA (uracil(1498)-N(3))-methyltransferase [Actinomycetota bacterium]